MPMEHPFSNTLQSKMKKDAVDAVDAVNAVAGTNRFHFNSKTNHNEVKNRLDKFGEEIYPDTKNNQYNPFAYLAENQIYKYIDAYDKYKGNDLFKDNEDLAKEEFRKAMHNHMISERLSKINRFIQDANAHSIKQLFHDMQKEINNIPSERILEKCYKLDELCKFVEKLQRNKSYKGCAEEIDGYRGKQNTDSKSKLEEAEQQIPFEVFNELTSSKKDLSSLQNLLSAKKFMVEIYNKHLNEEKFARFYAISTENTLHQLFDEKKKYRDSYVYYNTQKENSVPFLYYIDINGRCDKKNHLDWLSDAQKTKIPLAIIEDNKVNDWNEHKHKLADAHYLADKYRKNPRSKLSEKLAKEIDYRDYFRAIDILPSPRIPYLSKYFPKDESIESKAKEIDDKARKAQIRKAYIDSWWYGIYHGRIEELKAARDVLNKQVKAHELNKTNYCGLMQTSLDDINRTEKSLSGPGQNLFVFNNNKLWFVDRTFKTPSVEHIDINKKDLLDLQEFWNGAQTLGNEYNKFLLTGGNNKTITRLPPHITNMLTAAKGKALDKSIDINERQELEFIEKSEKLSDFVLSKQNERTLIIQKLCNELKKIGITIDPNNIRDASKFEPSKLGEYLLIDSKNKQIIYRNALNLSNVDEEIIEIDFDDDDNHKDKFFNDMVNCLYFTDSFLDKCEELQSCLHELREIPRSYLNIPESILPFEKRMEILDKLHAFVENPIDPELCKYFGENGQASRDIDKIIQKENEISSAAFKYMMYGAAAVLTGGLILAGVFPAPVIPVAAIAAIVTYVTYVAAGVFLTEGTAGIVYNVDDATKNTFKRITNPLHDLKTKLQNIKPGEVHTDSDEKQDATSFLSATIKK